MSGQQTTFPVICPHTHLRNTPRSALQGPIYPQKSKPLHCDNAVDDMIFTIFPKKQNRPELS